MSQTLPVSEYSMASLVSDRDNLSTSSSDISGSFNATNKKRTKHKQHVFSSACPDLEFILNKNILGKHAGQLLLELHQFPKDEDAIIYTLPGIILNKTNVSCFISTL